MALELPHDLLMVYVAATCPPDISSFTYAEAGVTIP